MSWMFVLFVLTLGYVALRSPRQLAGAVGMLVGYLFFWSGACLLCDQVFLEGMSLPDRASVCLVFGLAIVFAVRHKPWRDTTVKAVTLYFMVLTSLSALALWVAEGERTVTNRRPVLKKTSTMLVEEDGTRKELRTEMHTYTEEYVYKGEKLIDCWFTSVSAACVTGLIVTDTEKMSFIGQLIVVVTIQAGGLGIIFFTAFVGFLVARGRSTRGNLDTLHAEALDVEDRFVSTMIRQVLTITFFCEGLGALILWVNFQFFTDPAAMRGVSPVWAAIFLAVSSFCNAGFAPWSDNLMTFIKDPIVNGVISGEIILGGLGYAVLIRLWLWMRIKIGGKNGAVQRLTEQLQAVQATRLQTWICLQGTIFLLKLGTVAPLLLDWRNPVYGDLNVAQKVMCAFFHSVSARTAGFNTVDLGTWPVAVLLVYIVLMYIGACPQGTGGGIKITTMRLLLAYVGNWFRAPYQHVVIRKNGEDWLVHRDTMSAAIRLLFSSLIVVFVGSFLITIFERQFLLASDPTFNYLKVLFETVSGFGTVGLSMGYDGAKTSFAGILTSDSKIVLVLEMLIGRLGPLTVLALLPWRKEFGVVDALGAERMKKVQVG